MSAMRHGSVHGDTTEVPPPCLKLLSSGRGHKAQMQGALSTSCSSWGRVVGSHTPSCSAAAAGQVLGSHTPGGSAAESVGQVVGSHTPSGSAAAVGQVVGSHTPSGSATAAGGAGPPHPAAVGAPVPPEGRGSTGFCTS
jgi:hypothetical protein